MIILCKKRLFFAKRRLFFAKKIILCKKKIILHKKEDYSLQKRLFFAKKKIILCKRNRFGPDVPLKMGFDLEFIRFMFFTCLSFVCLSQFTNKQTSVVYKQTNISFFVCISETNATNICLLFLHSPNIRVVSSCPPKTMIGLNKL